MKKLIIHSSGLLSATLIFLAAGLCLAADEAGFKSLFNGKDLSGWAGRTNHWSVEDGAITGVTTKENPAKGNNFLIAKEDEGDLMVEDFELRFSYKFSSDWGNSGVQYRSKNKDNFVVNGYQADFETGQNYSGILYEEGGRGILCERGKKVVIKPDGKKEVVGSLGDSKEIQATIKTGDWNEYGVIAKGNHIQHFVNGKQTADVVDEQESKAAKSGILALQLHAGPPMKIQFKDIKIKPLTSGARSSVGANKKVVFIAGNPSHGPGDHEHRAGCLLFQKCLDTFGGITSAVYSNGWPKEANAFEGADAVVIYSDGGGGHPAIQKDRLQVLGELMKKGVGFGCIHYAVEVPKEKGGQELLAWTGGYFETYYSVNPFWTAEFTKYPEHPIARGLKPFKARDEWYYHMRFPEGMKNVTPILTAVPPDNTRGKPGANDAHGGNPEVQQHKGEPEHLMWAIERPDGGRGFGFTGGHPHKGWGEENMRKAILNAVAWIAKAEVPANGVESVVSDEDLKANLDPKGKK